VDFFSPLLDCSPAVFTTECARAPFLQATYLFLHSPGGKWKMSFGKGAYSPDLTEFLNFGLLKTHRTDKLPPNF